MSQQQNPLERAVDLFVFAPIGVAMFARDTVPTFVKMFVSRGQTEIQHRKKSLHDQANQYRAVGRFAVRYGGPEVKRQAESRLDDARRMAEETFAGLVVSRGGGTEESTGATSAKSSTKPPTKPSTKPVEKPAKVDARGAAGTNGAKNGAGRAPKKRAGTSSTAAARAKAAPQPVATALAIPEYDQLSASQVVERLDGLTPGELDAVRDYELAHRGRNTILGKITQLTS